MRKETDKDFAEFDGVIDRLRADRHEASPLELDQMKTRAVSQATRHSTPRRGFMRTRLATLLVAGVITAGTTGGVIAHGGDGNSNGDNASNSQYGCHGSHCSHQPPPPPRGSHGSHGNNGGGHHGSHGNNGGGSHNSHGGGSGGGNGHHGD
jgi:hypothetical protein